MRKTFLMLLAALFATTAMAIPAKRGTYKTLTLSDGTTVKAELRGDEHVNFWQAEDGRAFVKDNDNDFYVLADVEKMVTDFESSRAANAKMLKPRYAAGHQPNEPLVGEMKGLIVLVEFADTKFKSSHTRDFYNNVANTEGFSNSEGFVGSVRDYFLAQSDGLLDYTFDVTGPVTLTQNASFYGKDSNGQQDINLSYFVEEALNSVSEDIDFSKYDNDGDGEVDQVFFLYAGKGQADGGGTNTIWPHMFYVYSGLGVQFNRNGVGVDVYACSNELSSYNRASGIGAICHEFSHCLGLPDMYDTQYGDNYGSSDWDIMNSGSYLGNSFTPCGYTAYERAYCGWRPLIELTDDTELENLPSISNGGSAYVKYNNSKKSEYYIFEPRSKSGWDKYVPGEGLLVYHVDYSASAWTGNVVNNTKGHQRCAIVAADDSYSNTSSNKKGDAFPYTNATTGKVNNSFGDNTTPKAEWFNINEIGTKETFFEVYDITKGSNSTVNFKYKNIPLPEYHPDTPEGAVFYESFGRCFGVGGNDNVWSKMDGTTNFMPDLEGWEGTSLKGAKECALVGNTSTTGKNMELYSPVIELDETKYYKLTFKTAPYSIYTHNINLQVRHGEENIATFDYAMPRSTWSEYEAVFPGNSETTMVFWRDRPFYIDEILIVETEAPEIDDNTGVANIINSTAADGRLFNLSGQRVDGNSYKGIVIRGGKKILNR